MTTPTFTYRKSFLVCPYISVQRFKELVQLLPGKIRKFSCLIFGAYVFALTDWTGLKDPKMQEIVFIYCRHEFVIFIREDRIQNV